MAIFIGALLAFGWYPAILLDAARETWRRRQRRRAIPEFKMHPKRGGPRPAFHDGGGDLTADDDGQPFHPGRKP